MKQPEARQTPINKSAEKLQAELAQAWRDIETLPIAEIGARNPGVLEYMKHWEDRALEAETLNQELLGVLKAFSDYVHHEQSSTDGEVTYSTTSINHWAFLARAAIAKAEEQMK